jgi:AcrR family transcriptional regulator
LRAEQTALTRRRILDAAGRIFAERGHLGTTLTAVAQAAGTSVQTVYNVIGGKPLLLKAVYDITLAGDDEPVPLAQRPIFQAVINASTARECLGHYAGTARQLFERTLPLATMALAQAATGDPDLREFADTIEAERAPGPATPPTSSRTGSACAPDSTPTPRPTCCGCSPRPISPTDSSTAEAGTGTATRSGWPPR